MTHAPAVARGFLRWSLCAVAVAPAAMIVNLSAFAVDQTAELRIETAPGKAAPFRIEAPADGAKGYALVIIRGLSDQMSLEPAIRSGDAWYVSAKDLPALKIVGAPDGPQVFALTASFVQPGKSASSERSFALRLEPRQTVPTTGAAGTGAQASLTPPSPAPAAAPPSEEERYSLAEAATLLKNGDVAAARLLYEELAETGSPRGAFAMGQTYDPNVLAQMSVQGLAPDPAKARRWYEKAAGLGSREAAGALQALQGARR